ncbi:MAG: YbhB/YbcL family Raf kinase inhibitor-like protein [bacterium]
MKLSSPSFADGQPLPQTCAYRDKNLSPELTIEGVSADAQSLVLIVDDPDASVGTWNHWLVWNIAPDTKKIAAGETPANAVTGKNDFGNARYDGPAPPSGTHRYMFKLYALNKRLDLKAGATRRQLDQALQDCVIDQTALMGSYKK